MIETGGDSLDWSRLSHAYGPATDTPVQLKNLLSDDADARETALEYFVGAVLHQETIYSATAPAAVAVSRLVADPRTLTPVSHFTDLGQPPRLLRESLLDFLATFAESAGYERAGVSYGSLAARQSDQVEHVVECLWRGDFKVPASDEVRDRASDVYEARAVLQARGVLAEIAPRVVAQMTASDPRVRQSAANAAAKIAKAMNNSDFAGGILSTLETIAATADPRDRASLVMSIGELGGDPGAFLDDPEFVVRACAALAPQLANNAKATAVILQAVESPNEIDRLTDGIPQFQMRARFSFVIAAVERVETFDELLPGALAIAAVGNAYTVEHDIGPLLAKAFPAPYKPGRPLTHSQRTFLEALVTHEDVWSKKLGNPKPWFERVGLLYDREACRGILSLR